MSHIENELYSQPECWDRAAELALDRAALLPEPGERVAIVGCGTSLFMAQAAAALREEAGHGETHAHAASEFPAGRHYDRVVALTRSGATTEVLRLLAGLRGRVRTTVITTDAATPVASAADDVLVLAFADEKSVVQTRFPTSALTVLRTHFGLHSQEVVDDAHDALAEPLPPWLVGCTQFTFLGRGWTVGLAGEAAHKMRESQLPWAGAHPALEYRHGPISVSTRGTVTWMLGDAPAGLADEVHATGGMWVAGGLDPLAELVRTQRLAVAVAVAGGRNPDRPRHLTRSVILARV